MYIRAGIVYQIIKKVQNQKILKDLYREVTFWSGWHADNEFLYDMHYIAIILDADIDYPAPVDFDMEQYYRGRSQQILQMFDGIPIQMLYDAMSYYLYNYRLELLCELAEIIPKYPADQWFGKNGKSIEKSIKFIMSSIYGYSITSIDRGEYVIPNTDIHLMGKADGYISKSPGGIYDDHVLECKYTPTGASNIEKNRIQIACYHKIYGKPVLLAIYSGADIKLYRYSCQNLARIWDENIEKLLVPRCFELENKLKITDTCQVPELIKLFSN